MRQTIFERITNQIAEAIASGADTFTMPWHRSGSDLAAPFNASSGRAYRGLNVVTLWMSAQERAFASGRWATYRQWAALGAQVCKGEKGTPVFFWEQRDSAGNDSQEGEGRNAKRTFVAKAFTVFNADQVSGYDPEPVEALCEASRLERAEAFIRDTGATIEQGLDCACYIPSRDIIQVPAFKQFRSPEGFYSVLIHELSHWTGAKHRLDRNLSGRFGSEAYAMEELIAELGAAFTCARLGIVTEPRRDHAPYIASWLKVLRSDPRAVFTAASKAQEASDYLAQLASGEPAPGCENLVESPQSHQNELTNGFV